MYVAVIRILHHHRSRCWQTRWACHRAAGKDQNNAELRARLEAIQPDASIVVAYGRIIPDWMLRLPRWGNLNLHASLLPKYRGAAPIEWAVANGETVTGATAMVSTKG